MCIGEFGNRTGRLFPYYEQLNSNTIDSNEATMAAKSTHPVRHSSGVTRARDAKRAFRNLFPIYPYRPVPEIRSAKDNLITELPEGLFSDASALQDL